MNWFSKQSTIALAFSLGWYVIPKGPWTSAGTFGPSLFISDFATCHVAWGVTSQFPTFFPTLNCHSMGHHLMVLATQLPTVLHAGSQVTCHSFFNLCLCFNRLFRPGRLLFTSESVILLVNSLYAEAIEAAKSRITLSVSYPELIWILGEINSEARLWNRSQSVNLSMGSKRFLVLTWSIKWETTGRWSESRMSETMTSDSWALLCKTISSTSLFSAEE
jgi:hypothetical protein